MIILSLTVIGYGCNSVNIFQSIIRKDIRKNIGERRQRSSVLLGAVVVFTSLIYMRFCWDLILMRM